MYINKGWEVIDSSEAFRDSIFLKQPNTIPAGESIVWSLAKEAGQVGLRYPAEDGRYQKDEMNQLKL
jgi:hypothetical protein